MNNSLQLQAQAKAQEVLQENAQFQPPVKIDELVANYGLSVQEADLPEDVSGLINPSSRIIYVNQKDSSNRKAFTIAHELGHWLLHAQELQDNPDQYAVYYRRPIGGYKDPIEMAANAFAASLLVPKHMLKQYVETNTGETVIARIFGVSTDVINYRIADEFPERFPQR